MGSALLDESVQVAAIPAIGSTHRERILWERIVVPWFIYLCTEPVVLSGMVMEETHPL